jgi:adenosine deaminase
VDGLCIDTATLAYVECRKDGKTQVPASKALAGDARLYTNILDAMSMRQFALTAVAARTNQHDHFFATFGKFNAVTRNHVPEMLTDVVSRFARENVDYVESSSARTSAPPATSANRSARHAVRRNARRAPEARRGGRRRNRARRSTAPRRACAKT